MVAEVMVALTAEAREARTAKAEAVMAPINKAVGTSAVANGRWRRINVVRKGANKAAPRVNKEGSPVSRVASPASKGDNKEVNKAASLVNRVVSKVVSPVPLVDNLGRLQAAVEEAVIRFRS